MVQSWPWGNQIADKTTNKKTQKTAQYQYDKCFISVIIPTLNKDSPKLLLARKHIPFTDYKHIPFTSPMIQNLFEINKKDARLISWHVTLTSIMMTLKTTPTDTGFYNKVATALL